MAVATAFRTSFPKPERPAETPWPPSGKWTYEDYRRLPEDGIIYEIIEGELHMAPAPIPVHQENKGNLFAELRNYAKQHDAGKAYDAPIDVVLPGIAEPVQPDVLFIAKERLHIVKPTRIEGAPDLIVEVLTPSNAHIDRGKKFRAYARAGVREYWLIDPHARTIELFVLRDGAYHLLGNYADGAAVRSAVLPGFEVKVDEICPAS